MIEPVYLPYWEWEDIMMYHPPETDEERVNGIKTVIDFFTDPDLFRDASREMMPSPRLVCITSPRQT